jgi:RNA polymerase sigma-70 factor, ECF subfamily
MMSSVADVMRMKDLVRGKPLSETLSATSEIFTAWLQDYGGIPVKVARSFAFNPEDQRDLRQQMYLQIWRSMGSFSAQAKASTWIYRVCLNTAMTWRRSEKRRRLFLESINSIDLWPNESDTANDPRLEALYSAIRQLRPADRALILLYLEERSYREIAEITGLSESNTGVRLQRVKRELAQRLSNTSHHD